MTTRTVNDSAGRTWTCTSAAQVHGASDELMGRDVVLSCTTDTVDSPVQLTVGWQWEQMASAGLARLLTQASPVPRR